MSFLTIFLGSSEITESMSVLTDPATYGILNSEVTNCPRTAAVLRELATQWQQMMGSLQRDEQETVSPQHLAKAFENMTRTRIDMTGNGLRLKDGERLQKKSWSGSTPLGGCAREVAAWLGYVDREHETGKVDSADHEGGRPGRPRRGLMLVTLKTTSMVNWTMSWWWH